MGTKYTTVRASVPLTITIPANSGDAASVASLVEAGLAAINAAIRALTPAPGVIARSYDIGNVVGWEIDANLADGSTPRGAFAYGVHPTHNLVTVPSGTQFYKHGGSVQEAFLRSTTGSTVTALIFLHVK